MQTYRRHEERRAQERIWAPGGTQISHAGCKSRQKCEGSGISDGASRQTSAGDKKKIDTKADHILSK